MEGSSNKGSSAVEIEVKKPRSPENSDKPAVEMKKVESNPTKAPNNKTKRRGVKLLGGCIFVILFMLCIFIFGTTLGIYFYPRASEILEEYGVTVDWFDAQVSDSDGDNNGPVLIAEGSEEALVVNVVEESMPSVVTIAVSRVSFSPDDGVIDNSSNIGSGFIVDPNGLIITNQHVVANPNVDYKVITSDGEEYDVENIARDDANDIALLEIEASGLEELDLGDSDELVAGQTVVAIGTPLGEYAGSVTRGVVSGLNRSVKTGDQSFFGTVKTYEDVIQTDASVNPGNSGGPLLNTAGLVVGVNFATTAGADNISFALPINRVKQRIEEYRKYGKFIKGYLGVQYEVVYTNDFTPMVLVIDVEDGSPADEAGIKRRDLIIEVDGEPVGGSFASTLQSYKPGDEIKLTIIRDDEEIEVEVTLGEV